jgi:aryl-alcohol dehydrogenase-like predicted oxidoreductase
MNKKRSLVLGTEVFSGDWGNIFSEKMIEKILVCFYENNFNELDTAPSYGKNSLVEKLIGKIIKKKKFKISSKFKIDNKEKLTPKIIVNNVKNQLDMSLKNLNIDCLETYYFHSEDNKLFFIDEIWHYLNLRKEQGDIKNLGLSMKHQLVVDDDLKQIYHAKEYGISIVQTVLNIYNKHSLNKLIPFCDKNKIDVYGRMPLAKGLLSGKYNSEKTFSNKDPRKNNEFTKKIIKFRLENKNLNLEKIIKWPLKNTKKIIFSVKNTQQLKQILRFF